MEANNINPEQTASKRDLVLSWSLVDSTEHMQLWEQTTSVVYMAIQVFNP